MASHSSLIILFIMAIIAMWMDIRYRKIPNWLTFSGIISGFLFHLAVDGLAGLQFAGLGFVVGLAILFIPFAKGGMGAGDVKFLAMIGTWMGVSSLLPACLWMAIIGAGMAVLMVWRQGIWKLTLIGMTVSAFKTGAKIPYGVAIGLGAMLESARSVWLTAGGGAV